jgi:GntR family transcriptional regulator, transcriptional repressor for pyruvate dehydrogenase complex
MSPATDRTDDGDDVARPDARGLSLDVASGARPYPLGEWRAPKISQKVAMAVVEEIVARNLVPGDRLPPEAEMIEQFHISRASLREGLRLLETYGVITIRQGQRGGPEIGSLGPGDVARALSLFFRLSGATYRDVFDARILVEPVMSRIAAQQQAPDQMDALRAHLELERTKPSDDDYVEISNSFHQLVSGLSGNPVLDLLGSSLRALYAEPLFRGHALPKETLAYCRKAHPKIGAAILAGDGESAQTLMAGHMVDLNRIVNRRAAWFLDDRVTWEV